MKAMSESQKADPARLEIGKTLGRIPSGMFVLGILHEGQTVAMVVSWVQQAAFTPPMITMAIGKDRFARKLIEQSGTFALSILESNDKPLLSKFARPPEPGVDPFVGVDVRKSPAGHPVLAQSLAWIDCSVNEIFDFGGDHDVVLAQVITGNLFHSGDSMIHLRKSGFSY